MDEISNKPAVEDPNKASTNCQQANPCACFAGLGPNCNLRRCCFVLCALLSAIGVSNYVYARVNTIPAPRHCEIQFLRRKYGGLKLPPEYDSVNDPTVSYESVDGYDEVHQKCGTLIRTLWVSVHIFSLSTCSAVFCFLLEIFRRKFWTPVVTIACLLLAVPALILQNWAGHELVLSTYTVMDSEVRNSRAPKHASLAYQPMTEAEEDSIPVLYWFMVCCSAGVSLFYVYVAICVICLWQQIKGGNDFRPVGEDNEDQGPGREAHHHHHGLTDEGRSQYSVVADRSYYNFTLPHNPNAIVI